MPSLIVDALTVRALNQFLGSNYRLGELEQELSEEDILKLRAGIGVINEMQEFSASVMADRMALKDVR